VSEEAAGGERGGNGPLRRTFEVCVFAPIGAAVTLADELPELIEKGRRRVELQLGNAHVVGRFVVQKGRRDVGRRIDDILNNGVEAARAAMAEETGVAESTADKSTPAPAPPTPRRPPTPAAPATPAKAAPDPVAEATVQRALADYDTLSASQVVRRLESLGETELRAVQRYEASHRNRRTILNRAGQLLDAGPTASSAG
jgi:hypothetical protein